MGKNAAASIWAGYQPKPLNEILASRLLRIRPGRVPNVLRAVMVARGNRRRLRIQRARFDGELAGIDITSTPPPLFVIGHWRSGTTLLHNMLSNDARFSWPTLLQCFFPTSILTPSSILRFLARMQMPSTRPMDGTQLGPDTPQEDEFALAALGAPSPYRRVAFPNDFAPWDDDLDIETLEPEKRLLWERTFTWLLKALMFRDPRRLLLKSPPHSCRIPLILKLLPEAGFLHIVRSPRAVIPSTIDMWKRMYPVMSFERPDFDGIEDHVFATYGHVMRRIAATAALPPAGQYHAISYEALVSQPVETLAEVYAALKIPGFDTALKPGLLAWTALQAGYQPNRRRENPALQARITRECAGILEACGYD